jgi:hypothetical protein
MVRALRNEKIGFLAITQGEAVYMTIRHQAYCYMHTWLCGVCHYRAIDADLCSSRLDSSAVVRASLFC